MPKVRILTLDYLRGCCAVGIMVYHFYSWSIAEPEASGILGRIGVYGVSLFYVLSGVTLYHVYHPSLQAGSASIHLFFRKRFFRIFPLLWLATLVSLALAKQSPDATVLALNLTGLFGFISWDSYYGIGIWSIGNELVFYCFFVPFLLCSRRYKPTFYVMCGLAFAIYAWFAFVILDPDQTLEWNWHNYVNPLNQFGLFLGGFLIGYFSPVLPKSRVVALLTITIAVALFFLVPSGPEPTSIVIGWNRLIFTAACYMICFGVMRLPALVKGPVNSLLRRLGDASYSLYLLHSIVWALTSFILNRLPGIPGVNSPFIKMIIAGFSSIILSWIVYQKFERFFIRIGSGASRRQPTNTG